MKRALSIYPTLLRIAEKIRLLSTKILVRPLLCTLIMLDAAQGNPIVIGTYEANEEPLTETSLAILTEAYQQLNTPVQFIELPLRRALVMMLNNEIDGNIIRIGGLQARHPNLVQIPTPINQMQIRAYGLNKDIKLNRWEDLKSYKVIYLRGIVFIEENLPMGGDYREVDTIVEGSVYVASKASDILLITESVDSPPNAEAAKMNLHRLDTILKTVPLYHYLTKEHQTEAKALY